MDFQKLKIFSSFLRLKVIFKFAFISSSRHTLNPLFGLLCAPISHPPALKDEGMCSVLDLKALIVFYPRPVSRVKSGMVSLRKLGCDRGNSYNVYIN